MSAAQDIIETGKILLSEGFIPANDGNISVREPDGTILITPAGISKGRLTEEMLIKLTPDGKGEYEASEGAYKPSSETPMHLAIYDEDGAVGAVVHCHSPYATALASAGIALTEPILQESVKLLGEVPLAPFAPLGTKEVGESVRPFVKGHKACLLEYHGLCAWGKTLSEALGNAERAEHCARIYYLLRTGGLLRPMTESQTEMLK